MKTATKAIDTNHRFVKAMNLVAAIRAALVRSPQLRGQSVEVVTDRCGHVTLNGTVSSCGPQPGRARLLGAPGIGEVRRAPFHVLSGGPRDSSGRPQIPCWDQVAAFSRKDVGR